MGRYPRAACCSASEDSHSFVFSVALHFKTSSFFSGAPLISPPFSVFLLARSLGVYFGSMASLPGVPISLQGTTEKNGLKISASFWSSAPRLQPIPFQLRVPCPGLQSGLNCTVAVKAKLNKVVMDGSLNDTTTPKPNAPETKTDEPARKSSPFVLASKDDSNEFMTQVASLIKLVDSRDIVELQLKQLDCELLIRKKEAIAQTVSPAPVVAHHRAPSGSASSTPPPPAAAPVANPAKSSLPMLKCPMAGTFYRSPGPSEPPFVKAGDRVQKGQVLCIIEAMKLMNEIEADQSGMIVEILAEDGKPISVDAPLFLIQP
ncbi:hypothetical protein Nepgr_006390 [Nepenthes gracilis]|uniref:Biotin carboxyl carrier protein of acetyl-CoA carboxylase n=1 Tax=Nepenthes gracilis TaxID=150966 RepID=A0AAD3S5F1_NEPGR|nr:hypothetical protein Nepgr_006390 [Nepenthes gracilis]